MVVRSGIIFSLLLFKGSEASEASSSVTLLLKKPMTLESSEKTSTEFTISDLLEKNAYRHIHIVHEAGLFCHQVGWP